MTTPEPTTSRERLKELREIAEKAPPGPWGIEPGTYGDRITYIDVDYDFPSKKQTAYLGQRDKLSDSYNHWRDNAAHIAAFNPQTALELIDELERHREFRALLKRFKPKLHCCPEWDYLPIDEGQPEYEACACFRKDTP